MLGHLSKLQRNTMLFSKLIGEPNRIITDIVGLEPSPHRFFQHHFQWFAIKDNFWCISTNARKDDETGQQQ